MTRAKKVALVTGVTGRDGAYLAEFLLRNGNEVHGIANEICNPAARRKSRPFN